MASVELGRELFIELLQVAIGSRAVLSRIPSERDWERIYRTALKQSVVGLLFSAVEKLNAGDSSLKPGTSLFYQWLGEVTQIEAQNQRMNEAAVELCRMFRKDGIRSCVLKGQGLARLYPEPLRRQSGDIDLWVEGIRERTLRYLKGKGYETGAVVIHHVDAKIIEGVESEIHFLPIWMYNPWFNRRLQEFFRTCQEEQFANYEDGAGFCYPTAEFNIVYCLTHLFHHLLDEGIGLRQVVDYYFVLANEELKDKSDKIKVTETLRTLGLLKFAGAMMWVLQEICGMPSDWLICRPDERRGKRLLAEIMETGNMGHYDERYQKGTAESALHRNLRKSQRWMKLAKEYPSEVVCIPVWKMWHWAWRKRNGYS